jgi:hypothetical protein
MKRCRAEIMSIKYQNRLPIFAFLIVFATVAGLIGLHFMVDSIAKSPEATVAVKREEAPKNRSLGSTDDSVKGSGAAMPEMPLGQAKVPPKDPRPNLARPPANGVYRQVNARNNGPNVVSPIPQAPSPRNNADIKPKAAQAVGRDDSFPPRLPDNLSPAQQEQLQREFERHREMMEKYGPPGPDDFYPGDGDQYDYPDDPYYDGGYDYQGKNDAKIDKKAKTTDNSDEDADKADDKLLDEKELFIRPRVKSSDRFDYRDDRPVDANDFPDGYYDYEDYQPSPEDFIDRDATERDDRDFER